MKYLLFALFVLSQGCVHPSKTSDCPDRLRAVIDLGSGSTKMTMAEVKTCTNQIHILNTEISRAVPLEASKNNKGEISLAAQDQAIQALRELKSEAESQARKMGYSSFELAVVGTHALRTAANREAFISHAAQFGFHLIPISQEQEGQAGFIAVEKQPSLCTRFAVWDIGGGSAQIVERKEDHLVVHGLPIGAETTRKQLLRFKQAAKNCPSTSESPNPIGVRNISKAKKEVQKHLPKFSLTESCVIGIGSVHTKAVAAQIEKNWNSLASCSCGSQPDCAPLKDGYRKKDVECLIHQFSEKSDCDPAIKGPYSAMAESNLIMILAFMEKYGIQEVKTKSINMGHYFVTDSAIKFDTVKLTN